MKYTILIYLFIINTVLFSNDKVEIYTEHYPPYNMKDNGLLKGSSVDILDAMLKDMGSTQTLGDVRLTNWSRGYSLAQKRKNGMIFSTTRTEARESLFKWVGPIADVSVGLIALKSKNIKIQKDSDLKNYKIGAVLKDVGELLLLERGVSKKDIQNVSGKDAINISFSKMVNNRIDLFSYNTTVAFANAKDQGFDTSKYEIVYTLKNGQLYFAFNTNTDDKIIKKWQNSLDKIKADGTFEKIINKYK